MGQASACHHNQTTLPQSRTGFSLSCPTMNLPAPLRIPNRRSAPAWVTPSPCGQGALHPAPSESPVQSDVCDRSAFTLVELLAVILIIGLLAGLLTPAVMQALTKARNAAIKAEIDMLHMALMNYKNQYGSFPPCSVLTITGTDAASKHVIRVFPRTSNISEEVKTAVTPANAIYGWLSGYTDDPTRPVSGGTPNKLFDFDTSRVLAGTYYPPGKPNSPYIYVRSGTSAAGYGAITTPATYPIVTTSGTTSYQPELQRLTTGTAFFNPDSFQILSAGRDEVWNTDDDLSNFWPGTRREYLDKLKD